MRSSQEHLRAIRENSDLTGFQKKVLLAVTEIPRGEVRTYGWIAREVNSPKAPRAVGSALSKNPYAPYVPCHRVIRSDGSIGGYVHGRERKRKMLMDEGAWPLT